MNEMNRDDSLILLDAQTLFTTVKARIAALEFPNPNDWSEFDRFCFLLIAEKLVKHLKDDNQLSKQVSLEMTADALHMMVRCGFWWKYDDLGRI